MPFPHCYTLMAWVGFKRIIFMFPWLSLLVSFWHPSVSWDYGFIWAQAFVHATGLPSSQQWCCPEERQGAINLSINVTRWVAQTSLNTMSDCLRVSSFLFYHSPEVSYHTGQHHHDVMLLARISLTLSRYFSLSFIASVCMYYIPYPHIDHTGRRFQFRVFLF